MSPLEALAVIDQATDPRKIHQLTRSDFALVEQALRVLGQTLNPPKVEEVKASHEHG